MLEAVALTAVMLLALVSWHFWALRGLLQLMPSNADQHAHFLRSVCILVLLVMVHVTEVLGFSGAYFLAREYLEIGDFTSPFEPGLRDYLYFSLATYTTLGLSEFNPVGHMKLLVGFEALFGFIMLTWSATFFYSLSHRGSLHPK